MVLSSTGEIQTAMCDVADDRIDGHLRFRQLPAEILATEIHKVCFYPNASADPGFPQAP
jgi:hypothetical protein